MSGDPMGLIDHGIERALVAWIIAEPSHLAVAYRHGYEVALLGDYHARAAGAAAANVACRGEPVTPDAVRAELQAEHERRGPHRAGEELRELDWYDRLIASVPPDGAPIAGWCATLGRLAEKRRIAVDEAVQDDLDLDRDALTDAEPPPPPPEPSSDDIPPPGDDDAPTTTREKTSTATKLVRLARERAELWHSPEGELYASVEIDGHREHLRLAAKQWRQWLAHVGIARLGCAIGGSALRDATATLEGLARYEGPEHRVHTRIADAGDRIYIDLCDSHWRAVEIDREGWRIVDRPPVRFDRRAAMAPLPQPMTGGSLAELRDHVRIADGSWPLVVGWLVGALAPRGPYPVLVLRGQHGAGKSHGARRARSLIDPSIAPIRSEPREPRDLVISARASHVVALDNLSSVPPWLSDGLCRLATGGGYAARALYTDSDEIVIDVQRPTILTGITDVVTAPDLLDRSLLVDLEAIAPEDRETERDLDARWREAQPRILGALYTAVSTALARRDELEIARLPRLADWATWATAAEPALGLPDGSVIAALADQAGEATEIAMDASIIARPLVEMIRARIDPDWVGTAADLLAALTERVDIAVARDKAWPRTARGMASALARIAPALGGHGVRVDRLARTDSARGWRLTRVACGAGHDGRNDGRGSE